MTVDWQTGTLGGVLEVLRNGVNCAQDKSGRGDKVTRIESISNARFDVGRVGFAQLNDRDKERYRLQRGDILFSHINSAVHVGKTAVFDSPEPVYHGVNLLLMRPKAVVISAYLDYTLKYLFQTGYWRGVCKQSVNQASVNQQDISRVPIRYPVSLAEQQRIVGILDDAFGAIATARSNTEQNLRNAQEVLRAHLDSIFEQRGELWSGGALSDIATFTSGLWKGEKPPFVHVGVIRNTNFTKDGLLDDTDIAFLDVEVRQFKKRRLHPGDIILEKSGGGPKQAVGRVVLFDKTDGDFSLSNFTSAIRIKNPAALDAKYLHLYLHWLYLSGATESMQSHSTGIRNLNGDAYRAIRVRYPGRQEQERIADLADQLFKQTRRLSDLVKQKLTALDLLPQSLLHQAFTGAL